MAPVFPDPKWLELLKASRPQSTALGVACFLILLAPRWGALEPLPQWIAIPAFFFGTLAAGLAFFGFVSSAYTFFPLHIWYLHYRKIRIEKQAAAEYIPYMTQKEREIIGYLLNHNQKIFVADVDGGFAVPLISRRICVRALQPGQAFDQSDTPFAVPDHIWEVLVAHKNEFPYRTPKRGEPPGVPWRVPWMGR